MLRVECVSCHCFKLLPLQNVPGYNMGQVTIAKTEHARMCSTCPFLVARSAQPPRASKLQATIRNVDQLLPEGYANGQLLITKVEVEAESPDAAASSAAGPP